MEIQKYTSIDFQEGKNKDLLVQVASFIHHTFQDIAHLYPTQEEDFLLLNSLEELQRDLSSDPSSFIHVVADTQSIIRWCLWWHRDDRRKSEKRWISHLLFVKYIATDKEHRKQWIGYKLKEALLADASNISNQSHRISILVWTVRQGNDLSIERNNKAWHFSQPWSKEGILQYSKKVFPTWLDEGSYTKAE